MIAKKAVWFSILVALCSISVLAVDRTPFYDYSGNNNNVTAANNGALYNTTERVKNGLDGYTFDGANDYLTVTPSTISGQYSACNYTNTTNLTVGVNLQIADNTFSGMFFKVCHYDGDTVGDGYGFKVVANANRIAIQNGSTTVQSSNATGNLTYGQPFWVFFAINGNNTTVMYQNGTVVFNGSVQARNANASTTDNTTIGAQNGGAQRFNGTIYQILMYKRILTTNEILNITNGSQGGINPVDTLNLTLNINFRNTTTVNLSVNTGNFSRTIPTMGVGYHTQPSTLSSFGWVQKFGEAGYYSPLDFINAQALFRRSRTAILRSPTDFSNSVNLMTIIDATNVTLGYRTDTTNGTINRNMNSYRQLLNQTASVGGLMMWHFEDTFLQNANNSSPMCNYGTSNTFSATCMPLNGTREAQGRARWIIDVGCFNYSYPVCIIGDKNEPYNPGSANFWLPNGTCSQRSAELIREYNESGKKAINDTFVAWGYNISKIHSYSGPSFADLASSGTQCSEDIGTNFTIAYPYGGTYSPDYQETHLYSYDVVGSNLPNQYAQWQSRMTNRSYTCNWGITEGGLLDDNDNYNERFAEQAITGEAEVYRLTNTCSQFNTYFQLTYNTYSAALGAEAPSFHTNQLANNQGDQYYGKFGAIKALNLVPVNTSMYTCLTNNTAVTCLYSKFNATKAYLYVVNKQGLQIDIDNITVSGLTINNATRLIQGQANEVNTTTSASGTTIDIGLLYPYGVGTYELGLNATNISATYQPSTYIVNITEPNRVQFNISLTNPSDQTYNIVWQDTIGGSPLTACVNLTTCTLMQGNYTSAGQYNITATVTGETNTLTKIWLLQINNTAVAPVINYCAISPSSLTTSDNAYGVMSAEDEENANVTYAWKWYLGGASISSRNASSASFMQHSPSVGTIEGGFSNGTTTVAIDSPVILETWNSVPNANFTWEVQIGTLNKQNLTLPVGCNPQNLRLYSQYNYSAAQCYNASNSSWITLLSDGTVNTSVLCGNGLATVYANDNDNSTGLCFSLSGDSMRQASAPAYGAIWESGAYWTPKGSVTSNISVNATEMSSSFLTAGSLILQCSAKDNNNFSTSTNSTPVIISGAGNTPINYLISPSSASISSREAIQYTVYYYVPTGSISGVFANISRTSFIGTYTLSAVGYPFDIPACVSSYTCYGYTFTFSDTENLGDYSVVFWANSTAGANSNTSTASFSVSAGSSGGGGGGSSTPPVVPVVPVVSGGSDSGAAIISSSNSVTSVNTTFKSEIPLINTYLFITNNDSVTKTFSIFTNRLLKSCEVKIGDGTPIDSITCEVNKTDLTVTMNILGAQKPISTVYEAEVIVYSVNNEAMKVPIKLTVFSLIIADKNNNSYVEKIVIFIIVGLAGLWVIIRLFSPKPVRFRR